MPSPPPSLTVSPPSQITVPGPSPLPIGWSAKLVAFDLDASTMPPQRVAVLELSGPNGKTFRATARCADRELWGLTPTQVAQYMWPIVADYVLTTINPPATPGNAGPLSVPVVFI